MPTYEYRCPDGHDFEHFVPRISEAKSAMPCPSCGKVAERRISAGGGLLFKGSGFYITDYGKDGKKDLRSKETAATGAAKSESGASPSSGSGAPSAGPDAKSAKPESKPASTTPAAKSDS